ncbi:hypothetical protein [Amycolatopsis sp. NPDC004079]|uniref:hypothetical protein n=1 Tax=Amycolatopsis sp. NPDC004079 TaxID=3154549 RepID=UPI0033A49D66
MLDENFPRALPERTRAMTGLRILEADGNRLAVGDPSLLREARRDCRMTRTASAFWPEHLAFYRNPA